MRVKLQLVLYNDDGHEETVTDIVLWKKDSHHIEHLGLTLAESKQLLKRIQQKLLRQQIDHYLKIRSQCPDCGATLKAKNLTNRSFRTLFGTFKLASPRLFHCRCRRRKTGSFRPLSALLTASVSPELLFIEGSGHHFCKKQQMQWSKRGVHLLLQARVKTLDRDWASVFQRWYPDLEVEEWEEVA